MEKLRKAGPLAKHSWVKELYPSFATTGGEISVLETMPRGERRRPPIEYVSAEFGGAFVPWSSSESTPFVFAVPADACSPLELPAKGAMYDGAIVLAERGGCMFRDKAANVEDTSASALFVVTHDEILQAMGTLGSKDSDDVKIPVGMITKSAGDRISALLAKEGVRSVRGRIRPKSYLGALGKFLVDAWKELENLASSEVPIEEERLEELRALHDPDRSRFGSSERAAAVAAVAA